ncbi:hypothetical protein K8942_02310 [Candidatus Peribacteria bacterium]|nr:MAG: hypothetical protein K8942_02310 [Candidatus Peribacteria bacterium]
MSPLSKTLIGAFIPFVLIVFFVMSTQKGIPDVIPSLDIGVEHTQPMTLEMTVTKNDLLRMIDMKNDTLESIAISVPAGWKRGEVRNVPLKAVVADEPSFGYVRWTLPPHADVSFTSRQPFTQLNMHNPSGVPLKIRLTLVDLLKNTGEHQVYLVQEGSVKIP